MLRPAGFQRPVHSDLDLPEGWTAVSNSEVSHDATAPVGARPSHSPRPRPFQPTCSHSLLVNSWRTSSSATAASCASIARLPIPTPMLPAATRSSAVTSTHSTGSRVTRACPTVREVRHRSASRVPVRRHGTPRRCFLQRAALLLPYRPPPATARARQRRLRTRPPTCGSAIS